MNVNCPFCQERVEFASQDEILQCPSCGKTFDLPEETTIDAEGPASSLELPLPKSLSRYRIIDRIGAGGASTVYQAQDLDLNRTVALKVSRPGAMPGLRLEQFASEARVAAQFRHPSIATIYDVGVADEQAYIVQEYIEGEQLNRWCHNQAMDARGVAAVCAQIARALGHAHDRGIVHRDIKPNNVIVDASGTPHIIDFGVAVDLRGDNVTETTTQLVGTVAYMTPEQASGNASLVDGRADIFSLGVILYELLTSQLPFRGSSPQKTIRMICEEQPIAPSRIDSSIPIDLEVICLKCLEKDPKHRYATAHSLADDLDRFAAGKAIFARQPLISRIWGWLFAPKSVGAPVSRDIVAPDVLRLTKLNESLERQVADRTQMLIATKAEHDLYRSLVESLPLCVYRKDADGKFVFTNDFFADVFGQTEGKTAAHMFERQLAEFQEADDAKVRASGEVSRTEEEHVRKDGDLAFFEVLKSPVHNIKGDVVGVQGLMWDVSDHAQLETALRNAKEAAETAKKAAEEANRSKSDFLANMSHELRTPLSGVLGYLGILRRDDIVASRQKANLDAIENCATHLLGVINDVLDLSKIESGQLEVDLAATDLHKLLRGVEDIVRVRAEAKGVDLSVDCPLELPRYVRTDAKKVRQILVNLLGNAVKFTERGTVSVRVMQAKDVLRFEVEDTGVGIDESQLEMIMQPFVQLRSGADGSGLGLAISKRFVERLNGSLDARSRLGEGSNFVVTLPMQECLPPETEDIAVSQREADDFKLESGQAFSVLIADDVEANRDMLDQHLSLAGFRVVTARDGKEAIDVLRAAPVDIVLMDIRMPIMDGLEAISLIRNDESLKHFKTIAITASVFREEEAKMIDAGFDDFLGKPFELADLFSKLRRHLGARYRPSQEATRANQNERLAGWTRKLGQEIEAAVAHGNIQKLKDIGKRLQLIESLELIGDRIRGHAIAFQLPAIRELVADLNSQLDDGEQRE